MSKDITVVSHQKTPSSTPVLPPTVPMIGVKERLRGEIIDPKCFAGAMKPGEGKPHKACAVLCLRGGIPPMFLTDAGTLHVLVDTNGGALVGSALEEIIPYVGDRVEINATPAQVQGFSHLRIESDRVRQLTY